MKNKTLKTRHAYVLPYLKRLDCRRDAVVGYGMWRWRNESSMKATAGNIIEGQTGGRRKNRSWLQNSWAWKSMALQAHRRSHIWLSFTNEI